MSKLEELEQRLTAFMTSFRLVFDYDWEFTKASLEYGGSVPGTFLEPGLGSEEEESNNWANRGALLASFRALVQTMEELGIPTDTIAGLRR